MLSKWAPGTAQRLLLGSSSGSGSSALDQDPLARGLQRVYDPSLEQPGRGGRQPRRDPALRLAASPFNADMSNMRWGAEPPAHGLYECPLHGPQRPTKLLYPTRMQMSLMPRQVDALWRALDDVMHA